MNKAETELNQTQFEEENLVREKEIAQELINRLDNQLLVIRNKISILLETVEYLEKKEKEEYNTFAIGLSPFNNTL